MGHQKLREEKNCLNCGHVVEDRFCTHCGQENLVIHDTAFHLIVHYFQDLFHYDGRFWHTLRNLFRKPGQVAVEYIEGKRRQNIEPVKLYVFASSVFFLLLFIRVGSLDLVQEQSPDDPFAQRIQRLQMEKALVKGTPDTLHINRLIASIHHQMDSLGIARDTSVSDFEITLLDEAAIDTAGQEGFGGWLQRRLSEKWEEQQKQHEGDEIKATTAFLDELFHKSPQLLFFSLPFFALCLQLLYLGRRKKNYAEHFIFSTYHYAFLFVVMIIYFLCDMGLDKMGESFSEGVSVWMTSATVAYLATYLLLSMKRFYGGRWRYLLVRYTILGFLFFLLMIVLFFVFAFLTFLL